MDQETALEALGISTALIEARGLRFFTEAQHLEVAEVGRNGREHLLAPEAAAAWRRMKLAAREDGISLYIVSAYRSIERQVQLFQRKLEAGEKLNEILAILAPPGCSEHHSGCAVDLSTPGIRGADTLFAETPAFQWLRRHAGKFNFVLSYPENNPQGYQYEPWHWCYARP